MVSFKYWNALLKLMTNEEKYNNYRKKKILRIIVIILAIIDITLSVLSIFKIVSIFFPIILFIITHIIFKKMNKINYKQ